MIEVIDGRAGVRDQVSQRAFIAIDLFVSLLSQWKYVTNLISEESFQLVWRRHVLDSVNLQRLFPDKRIWLDFGSGAGFPAVIIGILLAEESGAQVHCIESDGRKCAFLRAVVQRLNIPLKIYNRRAELISPKTTGPVDVVTARAFSSLERAVYVSESYLEIGSILILPRGKTSARAVEALDPNRYTSIAHANPLTEGGIFLQIQLRTGK